MDLTTRCPQCGSTFAASLTQLQLRKGYIRCPDCAHIFDGFDAVVPAGPSATGMHAAPQVVRQRTRAGKETTGAAGTSGTAPSFTISDRPPGASIARTEPSISAHAAPTGRSPAFDAEPVIGSAGDGQVDAEPDRQATRIPDNGQPDPADDSQAAPYRVYVEPRAGDPAPQPDFLEPEPIRYRTIGFYFWGLLSILGGLLLLAQGLYVYRVQLANQVPALRPALEHACVALHCRIPYARDISEIEIMNSSLQTRPSSGDAGNAGNAATQMILHFTLRNNLDRPQEWPTVVLQLLDFSGTVVVKKYLAPDSYLSANILNHPFGTHTEVIAAVPINMNGIKVSGFKLTRFFP